MPSPQAPGGDTEGLDERTRDWFGTLPVTLYVTGPSWWLGDAHFVSESIMELSGRPAADYLSNPELWLTSMVEAERIDVLERLQTALNDGESRLTLDYAVTTRDGTLCRIEDTLNIQRDARGEITSLSGVLQRSEHVEVDTVFANGLVHHAGDLLLELGEELECLNAGGDVENLLGMTAARLRNESLLTLMASEDAPKTQRSLEECAREGRGALLELRLQHVRSGYRWFEVQFSLRQRVDGGFYAIARDITERRRQSLQWDAYTATDELTSALNRTAFLGLLRQVCAAADPTSRLTLIVLDIDHLAAINTEWGRYGGDLVLSCIGEICQATLRERFSFGRLGDDDFALLLSGKTLQESAAIAERLRSRLSSTRVEFHGHWLAFSVSLGVAEHHVGEPAETFLERASQGLEQARSLGRDRVQQAV
ncbi:sensor domain-containing diguanylate cyclase [Salinicola halophilus]|uniref:sensor domain-containing diguanylate cyclase n=1 Tax=Salinicola halophilus TaxID=184065 RepID=UPI000DA18AE4|nr:diguanylate cyclase [Salinicola halophilus]